jgi:type III secretion protein D
MAEWTRLEAEASEDDAASEDAGEGEPEETASTGRRKVPLLVPLVLTLALAGIGTLWVYGYFTPTVPDVPPVAMPLAGALRASEFASLTTTSDPDGRIVVRGRLSTLAQRTKLDQWLTEHRFAALVDVQVDEALARDVTEVFRVNGVSVQATAQGAGQVVAEASEPNAERLSKATDVVRRDVRGLEKLVVRNHAAPPPPPAPPVMDDPNKRIASIVPGEPAYLVTADGSRYFVGSLLPSGHRITAIAGQRVTLERDGQAMNLNL